MHHFQTNLTLAYAQTCALIIDYNNYYCSHVFQRNDIQPHSCSKRFCFSYCTQNMLLNTENMLPNCFFGHMVYLIFTTYGKLGTYRNPDVKLFSS